MDARTKLGWITLHEDLGDAGVVCRRYAAGSRGQPCASGGAATWPRAWRAAAGGRAARRTARCSSTRRELILALRRERGLGVKRLRIELIREHGPKLALGTVHQVLVRHGERFLKRRPLRGAVGEAHAVHLLPDTPPEHRARIEQDWLRGVRISLLRCRDIEAARKSAERWHGVPGEVFDRHGPSVKATLDAARRAWREGVGLA